MTGVQISLAEFKALPISYRKQYLDLAIEHNKKLEDLNKRT
jgi:hypothetical protein